MRLLRGIVSESSTKLVESDDLDKWSFKINLLTRTADTALLFVEVHLIHLHQLKLQESHSQLIPLGSTGLLYWCPLQDCTCTLWWCQEYSSRSRRPWLGLRTKRRTRSCRGASCQARSQCPSRWWPLWRRGRRFPGGRSRGLRWGRRMDWLLGLRPRAILERNKKL